MLRAGEAQHRVVNGYQKFRVASFKPSGKGALAKVLDNVVTHQTPELLRGDPHITFGTDHLGGMFTGAGQTNTSKTPLLGNLRIGAPGAKCAEYTPIPEDYKIILESSDLRVLGLALDSDAASTLCVVSA